MWLTQHLALRRVGVRTRRKTTAAPRLVQEVLRRLRDPVFGGTHQCAEMGLRASRVWWGIPATTRWPKAALRPWNASWPAAASTPRRSPLPLPRTLVHPHRRHTSVDCSSPDELGACLLVSNPVSLFLGQHQALFLPIQKPMLSLMSLIVP